MEETDSTLYQQLSCKEIMPAGESYASQTVSTEVTGSPQAELPVPGALCVMSASAQVESLLPPCNVKVKNPSEEELVGSELSATDRDSLARISSAQRTAESVTEMSSTPETNCLNEAPYVKKSDCSFPHACTILADEAPSDTILNVSDINAGDGATDEHKKPIETSVTEIAALVQCQIEEEEHSSSVITETPFPAEAVSKTLPVDHAQNADSEVQASGMSADWSDTDGPSFVTPSPYSQCQEQQAALITHSAESANTLTVTPSLASVAAFEESGTAAAGSRLQDGFPKAADEHFTEQEQTHAMHPEVSGLQEVLSSVLSAAAHEMKRSEEIKEPRHFLGSCALPRSLEASTDVAEISCGRHSTMEHPFAEASEPLMLEAQTQHDVPAALHCLASPTVAAVFQRPQMDEKEDQKEEEKEKEEEEKKEQEEEEKKEEKDEQVEKEEKKQEEEEEEEENNEEEEQKEVEKREEEEEKKDEKEEVDKKNGNEFSMNVEISHAILDAASEKPCAFADIVSSAEPALEGLAFKEIDNAAPDDADDRAQFDNHFQLPPAQIEISETQSSTDRQPSATTFSCEENCERSSEQKQDVTSEAQEFGLTSHFLDFAKPVQKSAELEMPSANEVNVDSIFNVCDASEPLEKVLQEFSTSLAALSPSLVDSEEKIAHRKFSLPIASSFPKASPSLPGQARKGSEQDACASDVSPGSSSQSLPSPRTEVRLGAKPFTAAAGSSSASTFRRVAFAPSHGVVSSSPVSPVTPENTEDDVFLSGSAQSMETGVSELSQQPLTSNGHSRFGAPPKALPASAAPPGDNSSKVQTKSATAEFTPHGTSQAVTQTLAQAYETGKPSEFQGAEDERQAIIKSLQVRKKVIKSWQFVTDEPQQSDAAKRCVRRPSVTQLLQQTESTPSSEDAANFAAVSAAAPPKVSLISPSRESSRGVVAAAAKTENTAGRFQRPVVGVTQNYIRKQSWSEAPQNTQPNGC